MFRVLLIDDDERLGDLLGQYFSRYEIDFESATRPSIGMKKMEDSDFDLLILDVMLPEMDGFEVCKTIRKHCAIPIIMLTARGEVMDRIVGLELGADDYLAKPFEPRELIARIHTVLKRTSPQQGRAKLQIGPLLVDMNLKEAYVDGEKLPLSSGEYQLLELFAKYPSRTFSRDELLNQLKGIESKIYSRAIDILVSRLRQKLKPLELIKTIRSRGYCFVGKSQ